MRFSKCVPDTLNRNSALINALAARGHNVTVLSPDEDKNPPKGVHYIVIEGMYTKKYQEIMNGLLTLKEEMNPLTEPYHLIDFEHSLCESKSFSKHLTVNIY